VVQTAQQRYWRRRARLLAEAKERRLDHAPKQKMSLNSHMASLDVDIIFMTSNKTEKKAAKTMKHYHLKLSQYTSNALKKTTNNNLLNESDLEAAFGSRKHTSSSEAYYSEQIYYVHNNQDTIPMDANGQARIFTLIEKQIAEPQEPDQPEVTQRESPQQHDNRPVVCPPAKRSSLASTSTQ